MLLVGNALEQLKRLADESIDCVITSPPYYLLRDYGEETVYVWGGDPDCTHKWGGEIIKKVRGDYRKASVGNNKKGLDPQVKNNGSFCQKCGAWKGQLGQEPDPDMYIAHLADIFDEVYRVLKPSGNVFIVIGDTYAGGGGITGGYTQSWEKKADHRPKNRLSQKIVGSKPWIKRKQLLMIPYRLAIEMQMRGWIIRDIIVWAKKVALLNKEGKVDAQIGNGMPESTKDRLTKAYEVIIHVVKAERYYFNKPRAPISPESISRLRRGASDTHKYVFLNAGNTGINAPREKREQIEKDFAYAVNVLLATTEPMKEAHYAPMPLKLARFLIDAGCPPGGTVLDPFLGSGTTAIAAEESGRKWIGIEANPNYAQIALKRLKGTQYKLHIA